MTTHGTPSAYQGGCRCGECRRAHRERVAAYRAGRLVLAATADAEGATADPAEGVVAAVTRTVAGVVDRDAEVAVALAMARVLDDPHAPAGSKPAAARTLLEVVGRLRGRTVVRQQGRRMGGLG